MHNYFKVVLIQPKANGFIRVLSPNGEKYEFERRLYPRLRMRDVIEGKEVLDILNGKNRFVVLRVLTHEDQGLIDALWPKPIKHKRKSDV